MVIVCQEHAPQYAPLIRSPRERTNYMTIKVADDIKFILRSLQGKSVALFGYGYKKNTADDRETPTQKVVKGLISKDIQYKIYDPYVMKHGLIYW